MTDVPERLRERAKAIELAFFKPDRIEHPEKRPSLVELIATALREIEQTARAEGERAWQPIETAPRDGTRILLRETDDEMWVGHWDTSPWVTGVGAWITLENRSDTYEIAATHWQPLPTPPAPTAEPTKGA